ncbi:DMT family transporter [Paenibacillus sp. D51F]
MMTGIALSILAGCLLSLQNIFNSKVSEKTGTWVTTALVLGLGFAASLTLGLLSQGTKMFHLGNMETWFAFSGLLGVGVVVCMVQGIKLLGPTYGVLVALSSQLILALMLDSLGWLGLEKVDFTMKQLIGVLVVIGGAAVFKLSGNKRNVRGAVREPAEMEG